MKLGTRLLVVFLPSVMLIMTAYAFWALQQREQTLLREARNEARAQAGALGLAFEHAFRDLQFRDVQAILNEVARQPGIHGVILYDTLGHTTIRSEGVEVWETRRPEAVREVVAAAGTLDVDHRLLGEPAFSVLRPIRGADGAVTGVLEVLQPLWRVESEKRRTGQRFLLNTLTLLVILALLTIWLMRRFVDRPIRRFVRAIREVGRGDLSYRVLEDPRGTEMAEVAREFNRMAEGLQSARESLLREMEERVVLEQRVRETEKLASMGTLAAGVAHQIAAPLNVIEGRARLLLGRDGSEDPERTRNLRAIVEQSRRIERIVRGLVEFARRPEPKLKPFELGAVVQDALERLEADLEEGGVELAWSAPEPLWVHGDPTLFQEVVMILVQNALDAIRDRPAPRAERRAPPRIEVRAIRASEGAAVEVVDDGPGIPPEVRARIFEAFFSTKPGGTGIGLAIARSVVERLGGTIEATERPPGRGAAFRFTLPLLDSAGAEDGAAGSAGSAGAPGFAGSDGSAGSGGAADDA